jgi:hemolysin activation/secretion protein
MADRSRIIVLTGIGCVAFVAVLCTPLDAAAQPTPSVTSGPILPRPDEIRRGTEIDPPRAAEPGVRLPAPQPVRREIEDAPGLSLTVNGFRITGLTRASAAGIEAALRRYTGADRSFQDLRDAVEEVKSLLATQGFPLAHVYLPEQELRDGIVEIAVLEGRLGRVLVETSPGVRVGEAAIRRYTDQLRVGEVITIAEVERVLFLLRDLFGIDVRSEFRTGTERGTADLVVRAIPAKRIDAVVELDNAGARFTGEYRATAGIRLNSPFGLGDSLSARFIVSLNGRMRIGLLSYAAPVGVHGTKLGASVTGVDYRIDPSAVGVDIRGDGYVATVFGLHPIVRSRNLNLFAQASVDAKRFQENVGGFETDRSIDLLQVSLGGDATDRLLGGGINAFSFGLGAGTVERPYNGLRVPTTIDRSFERLTIGFSRLQQLPVPRTLLLMRYAGQLTRSNLDPYEQFSLGGPQGVRAFPVAEAPGDRGHLLTLESRWSPDPKQFGLPGNFAVQAFFDWGTVQSHSDPVQANLAAGRSNRRTLAGPGIGAVWELPDNLAARASIAWATGGSPVDAGSRRSPRAYFTVSKLF